MRNENKLLAPLLHCDTVQQNYIPKRRQQKGNHVITSLLTPDPKFTC